MDTNYTFHTTTVETVFRSIGTGAWKVLEPDRKRY
jgi:hypothetical protein